LLQFVVERTTYARSHPDECIAWDDFEVQLGPVLD